MTTTVTVPAIPKADLDSLASEFELPATEIQSALQGILAEDILTSFPEDQRLPIAIGILRSRAMEELLDGGQTFHIHVLSVFEPTKVKPKEGDPFNIASVLGIGYIRNADGTDSMTGIINAGIFTRKDTPKNRLNIHKLFTPGKTYEASFSFKGKAPTQGQRAFYKVAGVNSTNPKEIPTPPGIDAAAFIKSVFPAIRVEDIPKKTSSDSDDINTWVSVDCAVIASRRGIAKGTGRSYGFYEVTNPGTKIKDLKSNPNAKTSLGVNDTQVKWTVGSRILAFGPITPPSDDGEYDARMRPNGIIPIVGLPYVVSVEANGTQKAAPNTSGATEDAAHVGDF